MSCLSPFHLLLFITNSFFLKLNHLLLSVNQLLWSGPILLVLLATHLFLTIKFFPQKKLLKGIKLSMTSGTSSSLSGTPAPATGSQSSSTTHHGMGGFQALATTLAATLGTGNIVGVSTAIALGGPGALFWCFLTGLLGMATTYSECYLSCLFRKNNKGGPMYVMEYGLGKKKLACIYAFFIVLSAFFVGSATQIAAIVDACSSTFDSHASFPFLSPSVLGMAVAFFVGVIILGGQKRIGDFCSKLIPPLSLLYMSACLFLLWKNRTYLPDCLRLILQNAFGIKSCAGGLVGSSLLLSARFGIARGLFTNEAGIGTAAITAGNADTPTPQVQSLISMTAVFWDTIVMCSLTGLAILSTMLAHPQAVTGYSEAGYTSAAFSYLPFFGEGFLTFSILAFAIATLIGWCYLGEQGFSYLFGPDYQTTYRLLYLVMIYLGAVLPIGFIFHLTDFINALMVLPNVFTLFLLSEKIKAPSRNNLPK